AITRAFGDPYRITGNQSSESCPATWPDLGLTILLTNFGADGCGVGFAQAAVIRGGLATRWRTGRGLRIGDSLAHLRHLYPHASPHARHPWFGRWWLVRGISPIDRRTPYGVISADVSAGHVRAIYLWIGAAG